ncbi:MAG: transposase [Patescibacteria group bacterium]|nr:transposase [Patescibacteria group bacterium]
MKVIRASKCSLKFSTSAKLDKLKMVLEEYGKVVNFFIDRFWDCVPAKTQLLKGIVNLPNTWLSARLRKVAAREAIDLILSVKNKEDEEARKYKPHHYGKSMSVSSMIASLQTSKTNEFDCWLHIASVGNGIILDLPVRLHKHFHRLKDCGKRLAAYVIKLDCVQFSFEIETGTKKTEGKTIGVDTGINALASTSDGQQYGRDVKQLVEKIKRKKHGSNAQQRTRRALRQRMDEVAKQVVAGDVKLVVVEDLKNMNHNTKLKCRLSKNMRRSLGAWAYRYWLNRIALTCEDNRVAYRKVCPAYTSQRCSACGHTERGNRNGEMFLCQKCGYADNADLNAAKNIEFRYTSRPYGAASKPKNREFCVR